MSSIAPTHSSNCRGGTSYEKSSYVVRVKEDFCKSPEETEALLVKKKSTTDLNNINIRAITGKTYTCLHSYLIASASPTLDGVTIYDPWSYVEVLNGTYWEPGTFFYTHTQPSTDCRESPLPLDPEPLPRGGLSFTKGTFNIRSAFQNDSTAPSTLRSAKMIVDTIDNVRITEWWTSYSYASLKDWIYAHHVNPKYHSYSPWQMIDVEVDGRWMTGTCFRGLSQPATPENTGPVLRH